MLLPAEHPPTSPPLPARAQSRRGVAVGRTPATMTGAARRTPHLSYPLPSAIGGISYALGARPGARNAGRRTRGHHHRATHLSARRLHRPRVCGPVATHGVPPRRAVWSLG